MGWYKRIIIELPPPYWFIWSGTLINQLGMFVAPFFMIYLTQIRHVSVMYAAASLSVVGIGRLVAAPIGGVMADRWGRRPTIITSLISAAFCTLGLGLVPTGAILDGLALMWGFTNNVFRPAAQAAIVDLVGEEHRRQAFALNYWAGNMGVAIGPMLAGLLMQWHPTAMFFLDGLTTLVFAILMSRCVLPRVSTQRSDGSLHSWRHTMDQLLHDRLLIGLAMLAFLFAMVYFQNTSTLPVVMHAQGLTDADYGLAIAMNGVTVLIFSLPINALIRHMSPGRAMSLAALLLGTGFGLVAFVHGEGIIMMTVMIWTLGEVIATPVAAAWIGQISPPHLRGTYQGIYAAGWGAAQILGPLAGGIVLTAWGDTNLWLICFGVGCIVMLGYGTLTMWSRNRLMSESSTSGKPVS
ncbi:MDR family MFS transporter [Sulfobacillus thermosulfidooxidans]|uniref:MDR family MFS transporter n=1 Tax=Sulfobacillus thermosulfidooxidans TaxID=28034 RepID=UPI0006B4D744|nr:MFS transporter [Sulfobacillus thermosulfidooxidans]